MNGGTEGEGAAAAADAGKERRSELLFVTACSSSMVALAALLFGITHFREILVPFTLALFFSYLLEPAVETICRCLMCRKTKTAPLAATAGEPGYGATAEPGGGSADEDELAEVPFRESLVRWIAVLAVMLVAIGACTAVILLATVQVQTMVRDVEKYHGRAVAVAANFEGQLAKININTKDIEAWFASFVKKEGTGVMAFLTKIVMRLVNSTVLFVLFLLFLLVCRSTKYSAEECTGSKLKKNTIWQDVDEQVRRYILLKSLLSLLVGLAVGMTLHFLNVDLAFLFAMLTFIANYIPNVGALVATLAPLPLVVLDPEVSAAQGVMAFMLPTITHLIVGSVLEPLVFEWDVKIQMHPVVVLLAMSFWGVLWGVPGMILSVPLAVVTKIALVHLEQRTGELGIFGPLADMIKARINKKNKKAS